jgi:predicted alpha/beta hydrolase family esterase
MENCLILHGTGGHDKENWFPWLKNELNKMGIKTKVPNFPNSDKPILEDWLRKLEEYDITEETILIGHSLACPLILRLLEKGRKIKAAYLVATFIDDLGWDVLKESNFFSESFNWEEIKKNCNHFEVFTSKNDPYLKIEHGQEVADKLNVKNQVLDVYKHFNMKEFPFLLEEIKKLWN